MGGLDLRPRILNMRTNMIVLTSAALLLSVTALQSPAMADRRRQCIMRHYFVLKKLGQFVDDKQDHLNIFIIGNERTGLWKKAFGLAKSEELIKVVDSVINDKPTPE
jgi:hypothetical protein